MADMDLDVEFGEVGEDFFEEVHTDDNDLINDMPPAKKNMVIFFVIDTSESMRGRRIETMNRAMQEVLPSLIGIGGTETDIRIAVLTFSSGTEWMTSEPMILEESQYWKNLSAGGVTDLGAALLELNDKMSRKQFLRAPSLSFAPVVFLITDGCPTDNYRAGIEALHRNNWFKAGIKIALALGDGVDMQILEEFTGDPRYVVQANNLRQLVYLVETLTVTSVDIGSKSVQIGVTSEGDDYPGGKSVSPPVRRKSDLIGIEIDNITSGIEIDFPSEEDIESGW